MKSNNAPDELAITVLEEDILQGKPKECSHCPIARAIERQTGQEAHVGLTNFVLGSLDRVRYDMPREASTFIVRFDAHEPVEPFSFLARRRPDVAQDVQ